ncbi:MAG TPA: MDR family MFS transporter [Candidatus Saccharimonadales bacterium]
MSEHNNQIEHVERSHSEIMVIIVALMLAMLLAALDQTIVSTALPSIARDLHGLNKLSWVATAYLLTSAVVTPIYGKVSDQIGRKKVFQFAIILFLFGSALCGISQNMNQLVIFRAIQGLGGGGLISLALATVGDIIPPRQRGKYQGYFGAVFALASIAGPLLGGLFTEHLSWRWIFYINIPLGLLAFLAIAARLHLPKVIQKHSLDYTGAVLMSTAMVSFLLALTWGGTTYAWGSIQTIGLFITSAVFTACLLYWEGKRAKEPIIPLGLFKNSVFAVSCALSLITGLLLLGAIIFLPEYQQVVRGESPTASGLYLLPLVGGMLISMITSGRLITRTGKYKVFPIFGTIIVILGLFLFSHITVSTSHLALTTWMVILGLGIGSFMQVMTLAVQNSVDRQQLGTATGLVTFFRSYGSSIGTAVFGVILVNRLAYHLKQQLPADIAHKVSSISSAGISVQISAAIREQVLIAFSRSFRDVFLAAIPFAIVAFVLALMLRETPLKTTTKNGPDNELRIAEV